MTKSEQCAATLRLHKQWGNILDWCGPTLDRKKWRINFKEGGPQYFTTAQVYAICCALECTLPSGPMTDGLHRNA